MMAADLRKSALDPSGCVFVQAHFYEALKVVIYRP